jgi:hypothetical protein
VTVRNALGEVVASGRGTSRLVDWTWDAGLTPSGSYRYTISAGGMGAAAARPVTGTIGEKLPPLSVTQFRVSPTVVSPNADGIGDTAQINYFLSVSAPVTMTLFNGAGQQLVTLFSGIVGQGAQSFAWKQIGVGDGRYTITLTAGSATGRRVTAKTTFYVDRTLAQPKLSFSALSPNGDGLFDATALTFRLDAAAAVRVEIWRASKLVGTLLNQAFGVGPAQVSWDGKLGAKRVADGSYQLVLKAKDAVTTVTQAFPIVVDTKPPRLRLVSRSRLRFWTNEPAVVSVTFGSRRAAKHVRAGYFTLPVLRGARHFTVVATDAVGNKATLRG